MVPLYAGRESCKGETDTANTPKSILSSQDKGHLFRVKGVLVWTTTGAALVVLH